MRNFLQRLIAAVLIACVPVALFGQNVGLPAGFAPSQGIGYGAVGSAYHPVTPSDGLPVAQQGTWTFIMPAGAASSGNQTSELTKLDQLHTDLIAPTPAGNFKIGTVGLSGDVITTAVTGVSAINTDLLTNTVSGWYDAFNLHSGSIDIYTTASISAGVVTFEQTNDTTNASAGIVMLAFDASAITANPVSSLTLAASTTKHYDFPILARYVRFRVSTGVTGGTVGATALLSQLPFASTRLNVQQATAGNLSMSASVSAGTATMGAVYLKAIASATTGSAVPTQYILSSAATTNSNLILTGARRLLAGSVCNTTASFKFAKLYDKSTAPTVGTDTPALIMSLPPTSCLPVADYVGIYGEAFASGLGIGITGAFATADTTAVAAGDVVVSLLYM